MAAREGEETHEFSTNSSSAAAESDDAVGQPFPLAGS